MMKLSIRVSPIGVIFDVGRAELKGLMFLLRQNKKIKHDECHNEECCCRFPILFCHVS